MVGKRNMIRMQIKLTRLGMHPIQQIKTCSPNKTLQISIKVSRTIKITINTNPAELLVKWPLWCKIINPHKQWITYLNPIVVNFQILTNKMPKNNQVS